MTSVVPMIGRPSAWPGNVVSPMRSNTSSSGVSSSIAISSSTTSRSCSRSSQLGDPTIPPTTSIASGRWSSMTRA